MVKLWRHLQLNKYFLSGVLIFAYLQSIRSRIAFNYPITPYTFTPEAALGSFINACIIFLIVNLQIRRNQQNVLKPSLRLLLKMLLISMIICLAIFNLISLLIALAFGSFGRNFIMPVFARNNFDAALNICIYGSFYMAYWYFQKNKRDSRQLATYHEALSDSKIAQLKSQLNPHFLFNNLNILDQLIEEDAGKASGFLHDFAELYRYSLQTSDKMLVSVSEEIQFAEKYFRLIEHKYDKAYYLHINDKVREASDKCIPPFTLQLLIENAVDHNLGTATQPVHIKIESSDDFFIVVNSRINKVSLKTHGGRSLRNLQEQYSLLTSARVRVTSTQTEFRVQLPVMKFSCA